MWLTLYENKKMESQLEPLFQGILSTVKNHEKGIYDNISKLTEKLNDKEKQIHMLEELNGKLKLEMEDFLKVSFANRWKKKAEELEKQKEHIQTKLNSLLETNVKLNDHLDKKTELKSQSTQTDIETENFTISTQTEVSVIEIVTKKGSKYILKEDTLYTQDGKVAGQVIN